jgi:alpha-tubulin suppressor-like RCC1 family protein
VRRWLLALVFLAACERPFRPYLPAAVRITPDSVTLGWGATLQLHATVTDSAGHEISDRFVVWGSSNPAVATVGARGVVTALDGGRATITATVATVNGTAQLVVIVPVARVTFDYPNATVLRGASLPLTATARDSLDRSLSRALVWTSGDSAIATVDSTGVVAGRAPGTAIITATSEGRVGLATVRVDTVRFVAITAAESDHSCALTADGRAFCWGNDILGELGTGGEPGRPAAGSSTPLEVGGGLRFAAVAGGGWFTCGLLADGAGLCWGSGARGRLGGGVLENAPAPRPVAGGLAFTSLSTGWAHACAVTDDGTYCWGSGTALGTDAGKYSLVPLPVSGDPGFRALDAGSDFSCALMGAGAAWCWGVNYAGQIGDGSTVSATAPTPVAGGHAFTALSVGARHACGLTPEGEAWCWGDNGAGELGNGSQESALAPEPVTGGLTFAGLSAGGDFTCGWIADGTTYCWGANAQGQLGAASLDACATRPCGLTPLPVAGGLRFRLVRAGGAHTCGITWDDVLYCWGANQSGQLGDGTNVSRAAPARVVGQP